MTNWRVVLLIIVSIAIWYGRWMSGLQTWQSGDLVRITAPVIQQPTVKSTPWGQGYQWVWLGVGSEIVGVKMGQWDDINYGDLIQIQGRIEPIEINSDLSFLPRPLYELFKNNLTPKRWTIPVADVQMKTLNQSGLSMARKQVVNLFRVSLPYNESALLGGMVFGDKQGISKEFSNMLVRSGTLHVVVASGFNVMLIGGTLVSISLLWVRRQIAVLIGFVGIWLYISFIGFEAPVVRAGIMGSLAFWGIAYGQIRNTGWLLVISSIVMLWWRPMWLWDTGFQLSVMATAGLIWIDPILKFAIDRLFLKLKKLTNSSEFFLSGVFNVLQKMGVISSLSTTLSAQLAVVPILLLTFGQVSLWSPLVNMLVLWTVPYVTGLGMAISIGYILLGNWSESIFQVFLWCLWPFLKFFVVLNYWFGQFDTLNWYIPWWVVFIYFGLLIWGIGFINKQEWFKS